MNESELNREDIRANRLRIIELDTSVMNNKASVYQSRSMIEENRLMILSNYAAAFMGNRQLANHNTDQVLENRNSILRSFVAENDVEKDCILASFNKTSLDFLDHRSSLNTSVLEISEELAEINSRLIAVNEKIMEANESIVEFNNKQIDVNSELLDGALSPSIGFATAICAYFGVGRASISRDGAGGASLLGRFPPFPTMARTRFLSIGSAMSASRWSAVPTMAPSQMSCIAATF